MFIIKQCDVAFERNRDIAKGNNEIDNEMAAKST